MTRPRCPVCGTRLNEDALDRQVELGDGNDIMEQSIGGRGHIESFGGSDFDKEYAKIFLEKVEAAREYLRDILEIEDDEGD